MENAHSDAIQMWINPSVNIRIYEELAKKIVVFSKRDSLTRWIRLFYMMHYNARLRARCGFKVFLRLH